jgi:hypothetical protein
LPYGRVVFDYNKDAEGLAQAAELGGATAQPLDDRMGRPLDGIGLFGGEADACTQPPRLDALYLRGIVLPRAFNGNQFD